jgi:nucleotide-binding universal stress UspA family protein
VIGMSELKELSKTYASSFHFVHVHDLNFPHKSDRVATSVVKALQIEKYKIHYLKPIKNKTVEVINDWVRRFRPNAVVMVARHHGVLSLLFKERNTKQMASQTKVPLLVCSEKKK